MQRWRQRAVGLAGVAMAGAIAAGTWSGSLNYVATVGASMEPRLHQGDLALVRTSDTYQVGDVVAYHSDLLDTVVLHRIVERSDDRLVTKGDNNPWLDRDEPTPDELIGKLMVRIPRGGMVLGWLGDPAALLAAAVTVPLVRRAGRRHDRHHLGKRTTPVAGDRKAGPPPPGGSGGQGPKAVLLAAAAGLVVSIALGGLAFTRSSERPHADAVSYTQRGSFAYLAPSDGPVYDGGALATGDPVFLRLVPAVDLSFTYRLESTAERAVAGTVGLWAEIADAGGWHRSVELSAPQAFEGDETEVRTTLDITRLQGVIAEVESLTGVRGSYTVAVVADVRIGGTVVGQELHDSFSPELVFHLDPLQLRPAWTAGGDLAAANDATQPSQGGSLTRPGTEARQLSLFGRSLSVADARLVSIVSGVLFALALGIALVVVRPFGRDEVSRIRARHGHRIVHVGAPGVEAYRAIVEVTTIDDLVRLAEQYGCLILHHEFDGTHSYRFQVDQTLYRYAIGDGDA